MKKGISIYLAGIFFLFLFISTEAQIADGTLIKGSADAVYIMVNGKACWVSSQSIFNLLGLDWKNVKTIPDAELKKIPRGWLVVQGSGNPVYIINYGIAFRITDVSTFTRLGFEKTQIRLVQEERLKKIQHTQ